MLANLQGSRGAVRLGYIESLLHHTIIVSYKHVRPNIDVFQTIIIPQKWKFKLVNLVPKCIETNVF